MSPSTPQCTYNNILMFSILLLFGCLSNVVAEYYYATPSSNTSCPTDNLPCLTLNQYAGKPNVYFASPNVTIVLLPGSHTLDLNFHLRDVTYFTMYFKQHNQTESITCESTATFELELIEQITMENITFVGCTGIKIMSVYHLTLANFELNAIKWQHAAGLELNLVENVSMQACSFTQFSVDTVLAGVDSNVNSSGVVLLINTSNVSMVNGLFYENAAIVNNTSIISIWKSNVSIDDTFFVNNDVGETSSILSAKNSLIELQHSLFSNNTCSSDVGCAMHVVNGLVSIQSTHFFNNTSNAIVMVDGTIALNSSTFSNSTGAIEVNNSSLSVNNCIYSANEATVYGCGAMTIATSSNATIDNSFFLNNNGRQLGGAMCIRDSSTVRIFNSTFIKNIATYGGAIFGSNSSVLINLTTFFNNVAVKGGAACSTVESVITIHHSSFTANIAGLYGSGVYNLYGSLFSTDTNFTNNSAVFGGTVAISRGSFTANRLTFVNNIADGSLLQFINGIASWLGETYRLVEQGKCAPRINGVEIHGGAVYAETSTLSLNNSLIEHNKCTAIYVAQCIFSLVNTTFRSNNATDGGAIGAYFSTMRVESSTFINGSSFGDGGGGGIAAVSSEVIMNNATFINNTSVGELVGGGAIAVINCSSLINSSNFDFNTASIGGAMIVSNGSSVINHTSFNNSHTGAVIISQAYFSMENVSFNKNLNGNAFYPGAFHTVESIGTIQNARIIANKGDTAFVILNCFNVIMENCTFLSNQVSSLDYVLGLKGGVVRSISSTVTIKQSRFMNNTLNISLPESELANDSDFFALGGAMYAEHSTILIDKTIFSFNTCYVRGSKDKVSGYLSGGGALYVTDSTVTVTHSQFVQNSVIVVVMCTPFITTSSDFIEVEVVASGGAIFVIQSSIEVNDTVLSQNKAHYSALDSTMGAFKLINFKVSNSFGGALFSTQSIIAMKNIVFTENEASVHFDVVNHTNKNSSENDHILYYYVSNLQSTGGAVDSSNSEIKVLNSTFYQNQAYIGSAETIDSNKTLFNHSRSRGGAVFSVQDTLVIKETQFMSNAANISQELVLRSIAEQVLGTEDFSDTLSQPHFVSVDFATTFRYITSSGGSLFMADGNATIYHSDFLNNAAVLGSEMLILSCNVSFDHALFTSSIHGVFGVFVVINSTITMNNSTVENCTLLDGNQFSFTSTNVSNQRWNGYLLDESDNLALWNGSVTFFENSKVYLSSCSFINNVYHAMGCSNCDVYIVATHFKSNIAVDGGALLFTSDSIATISDSTFSNNTCQSKCTAGNSLTVVNNSTVVIVNVVFSHNLCQAEECTGGAVYVAINSKAHINDSLFIGNMCFTSSKGSGSSYGAAMLSIYSLVTIHNTTFHSNFADNNANISYGGAVQMIFGTIKIDSSSFVNNSARYGGALFVQEAENFIIESSFVQNTAAQNGAAIMCTQTKTALYNSVFLDNKAGRDGGAIYFINKNTTIDNTTFRSNTALNEGAAIYLDAVKFRAKNIDIRRNVASSILFIANTSAIFSGNTTLLNNSGSILAFISNVTFNDHTLVMHNAYIANSSYYQHLNSHYGGAVTGFQSEIILDGTVVLMYNKGTRGGVILLKEAKLQALGEINISLNTASESGAGIYAQKSELNFYGSCNISDNIANATGGGIHVQSSTIRLLRGHLSIFRNIAKKGGGMFLELDSKLYIIKTEPECPSNTICDNLLPFNLCYVQCNNNSDTWLTLQFTNNNAHYGGAVYVSDNSTSSLCESECFIQTLAAYTSVHLYLVGLNTNYRNVFFMNNTADVAGSVIFGGLLDRCSINFLAEARVSALPSNISQPLDALSYLSYHNVTNLEVNQTKLVVSSKPVRVCFCVDEIPDCYYKPPVLEVRKGERFVLPLVAVDQVNNTVANSTVYSIVSSQAGLKEGQSIQYTNSSCTKLQYNIISPHDSERLIIYADGPCKDQLKSQSVVDIIFTQCPIGFISTDTECDCDPIIFPDYITDCSISSGSVRLKPNVWISYVNETNQQGFVLHPHCPFDYCQPGTKPVWIKLNNSEDIDKQCDFNRAGKLCGSCKTGYSLSFGSSACRKCSNYWLGLLIVFGIAGILLVALLLVCNLTVPDGTINGLIFYANIVASNRASFIPFKTPNLLTVFIAWLNLDFGFQTCFFNGMNGYIKTWLQLAFPLYTLFLVGMIIVVSNHSTRFASIFSGKNPIATLATLILLSYTKLLRTIIAALSFTRLEYPSNFETVWLFDASIQYLEGKHIVLFIVTFFTLLIGLLYTSLLFFWQWLVMCPKTKALMWLRNTKLYSFMDAYQNPYNMKHRYWTGLLLFTRALLYLIVALNVFGDPKINMLVIICMVGTLLLLKELTGSRIYKTWTISILESSFFYNLIIFVASTLYVREINGNQEIIAYISVSIAFLTFLGIMTYHAFLYVVNPILQRIKNYRKTTFGTLPLNETAIANAQDDYHDADAIITWQECSMEVEGVPTPNDTDDSDNESDMSSDQNSLINDVTDVTALQHTSAVQCQHSNTDSGVVNFELDSREVKGSTLFQYAPQLQEEQETAYCDGETIPLLSDVDQA